MTLIRLAAPVLMGALAITFTACNNNDDQPDPIFPDGGISYVAFNNSEVQYDPTTGAWKGCYDPTQADDLTYGGLNFSHSANSYDDGAGNTVWYWGGFCPSNSVNTQNHSGDWLNWQWSNVTGMGVGMNTITGWYREQYLAFMVANWSASESLDEIPAEPSLKIAASIAPSAGGGYKRFTPTSIVVTNSTYAYYGMLEGTAFSKKFEKEDWFKLYVVGVKDNAKTGTVEIDLAKEGQYLVVWNSYDLTSLGTVDYIYLQMGSSDTGAWGMNNPAYVCIGGMLIRPE